MRPLQRPFRGGLCPPVQRRDGGQSPPLNGRTKLQTAISKSISVPRLSKSQRTVFGFQLKTQNWKLFAFLLTTACDRVTVMRRAIRRRSLRTSNADTICDDAPDAPQASNQRTPADGVPPRAPPRLIHSTRAASLSRNADTSHVDGRSFTSTSRKSFPDQG